VPFPFHCIECNKLVKEAFNETCEECKEGKEVFREEEE
tara:strand:+ start:75 stop:188 length:114 start_codon:yes stop_codon:yes gene_type:complete